MKAKMKAFLASVNSTASLFSSFNIEPLKRTAASHLASRPAHTCKDWTDKICPIIILKVLTTPVGHKPGFLFREIRRHESKASVLVVVHFAEHAFWLPWLMLHKNN